MPRKILPRIFGQDGVWGLFPTADFLSIMTASIVMSFEIRRLNKLCRAQTTDASVSS